MNKSTIKNSLILITMYCLLYLLPVVLNQYILDYTFNYALSHLTLSLFLLMANYNALKHHVYNYSTRFTKKALLFLLSCCVVTILFLLHVSNFISLPFLFTKASDVPTLLAFMECFSIYFCMHLNEGYLFHSIHSMLPDTWSRNLKSPISFALFVLIHLLMVVPFGMGDVLSQSIYYASIGGVLMIFNYFNTSFVVFVISIFIMLLSFASI